MWSQNLGVRGVRGSKISLSAMQTLIRQKRPNFRILYFPNLRPSKCHPLQSTARGACRLSPPFPLPLYFCDQFVAPEICHSRRHCSVCLLTINMVFSDKDKILIKSHKYTQNTVICRDELKSVHLKCNLFAFWSISA